jgi:hypothetical protein
LQKFLLIFGQFVFGVNSVYRAFRFTQSAVNTFIGVNYKEIWALIETVYRADFDTISMLTADATIANYKRHLSSILLIHTL